MFQNVIISFGLVWFSLFPSVVGLEQRPLRDVPSRELVKRLYVDELAQEAQGEIRRRMIEVGIYGIDKDRELVEALLETLDSKNTKVMGEAVIALSSARDQSIRKRLLQLLSSENGRAVRIVIVAVLANKGGAWPIDQGDIENIKSIVLERTDSIDGDFDLKGTAILALGKVGAVAALEELQKHEGIRQAFGDSLDAALTRAKKVKKDNPDQ